MTLAISMELNPLDSITESTTALVGSVQSALLETQASIQKYFSNAQASTEVRKALNVHFLGQYRKLKRIERKAKNHEVILRKTKSFKPNLEVELRLRLSTDSLLADVTVIKNGYVEIHRQLKAFKFLSLTSWSINRQMTRIHKTVDHTLVHIQKMQVHLSRLYIYTEQDYQAYQTGKLVGVAAMNPQALALSEADLAFMLSCEDEPIRPPAPAMMRALEHYQQCS